MKRYFNVFLYWKWLKRSDAYIKQNVHSLFNLKSTFLDVQLTQDIKMNWKNRFLGESHKGKGSLEVIVIIVIF